MLEARIQQQFFEAADLISQSAQTLSPSLAQAARALWSCIAAGGKVVVAGTEAGATLAALFAAAFTGRFERDRPPMAALALSGASPQQPISQLRALGQPGDLLLLIDPTGADGWLKEAALIAHEADMSVIVFSGRDVAPWHGLLADTDTLVSVPHDRVARVAEMHLLWLHSLCDAVDLQLMGELDTA